MSIIQNKDGINRTIKSVHANNGGINTKVKERYIADKGINRKVLNSVDIGDYLDGRDGWFYAIGIPEIYNGVGTDFSKAPKQSTYYNGGDISITPEGYFLSYQGNYKDVCHFPSPQLLTIVPFQCRYIEYLFDIKYYNAQPTISIYKDARFDIYDQGSNKSKIKVQLASDHPTLYERNLYKIYGPSTTLSNVTDIIDLGSYMNNVGILLHMFSCQNTNGPNYGKVKMLRVR